MFNGQSGMNILFDFLSLPPFLTIGTDALRLLLAFVLSVFIVNIYRWTHAEIPQKSFTDTLIILCMLISVVMVIIGDSIARAFSLVGALSIIRFRTAIQNPRDIGFVFYALAVGMAIGAGNPSVAVLATFLMGITILGMYYWHEHFSNGNEFSLEFCLPPDPSYESVYRSVFDKYLIYERLLEKRIKKTQLIELKFWVRLENPQEWLEFFNKLSEIENVTEVKMDKE